MDAAICDGEPWCPADDFTGNARHESAEVGAFEIETGSIEPVTDTPAQTADHPAQTATRMAMAMRPDGARAL